jgi:hypothetical protein
VGALIDVVDVELLPPATGKLVGHHLDAPAAGDVADVGGMDVIGWVVGRDGSPVRAVEIVADGEVIARAPIGGVRPDVARAYPEAREAARSGYAAAMSPFPVRPTVELHVRALMCDKRRVPLARIRGRLRWREDPDPSVASRASIVVVCHNQGHFLAESLESALGQTHPNVEVVLVDDGSTDNTLQVARRYPEVDVASRPRAGLAAARNAGLRRSSGDHVVFLDADDRLLPGAVADGLEVLRAHPACALVWGRYRVMDSEGRILGEPNAALASSDIFAALLERNVIEMHATVMYRRALFQHVGLFDESLRSCEDHDLLLRVARRFPMCGHDRLVADYRRHGSTLTRDPRVMLQSSMTVLGRQREHARTSALRRCAYARGRDRARELYGHALVGTMVDHRRARMWRGVLRDAAVLARHHPRGLVSLVGS